MNKRGLSDVVTTVLIILFAVVAVAVIGGVIMNQVRGAGGKINNAALCQDLKLDAVRCSNDGSLAYAIVQRGSSGEKTYTLSNVSVLFQKADGTIDKIAVDSANNPLNGLAALSQPAGTAKFFSNFLINDVKTAGIGAEVTTESGQKVSCDYSKTFKKSCFAGDYPIDGLVAYFPFNKDLNDYSGNGLNGAGQGTAGGASAPPTPIADTQTPLLPNKIITLDETKSQAVSVTGGNEDPNGKLRINTGSVFAWIKTSNAGNSYRAIVCKMKAYNLMLNDNLLGFYDWSGVGDKNQFLTTPTLNDNKWHFVGLTFQGTTAILYIDGASQGTKSITTTGFTQDNQLIIGNCDTASYYFNGGIDEVMVYNRVLTADEVAKIYNAQKSKFV
jgi:hypothetical protein